MKQNSKLRHSEQQETTQEHQTQQKTEEKEFSSVDELLRYDSAQTAVSPNVADKLNRSIAQEPQASSWWKKLVSSFKGK